MKVDLCYYQQKCSPITLVCGNNKVYANVRNFEGVRILLGALWKGGVQQQWGRILLLHVHWCILSLSQAEW